MTAVLADAPSAPVILAFPADRPRTWQDEARCVEVDPDLWFPEEHGHGEAAKRICRDCPVRAECLDFALEHQIQDGIFGGLTLKERGVLQRDRRAAA